MAQMPIINLHVIPDGAEVWLALRMNVYRNLFALVPVEVIGVFAEERDAAEACTGQYDMCGPLRFGKAVLGPEKWEGAYYPADKERSE